MDETTDAAALQVRRFDKQSTTDVLQFNEWSSYYGYPPLDRHSAVYIPDDGFIIDHMGCVFVYLTNTPLAYIDQLMLNPKQPEDVRHRAGYALIHKLMAFAVENDIGMYSWNTAHKSVEKYALHAGAFQFDQRPHQQWYWKNELYKPSDETTHTCSTCDQTYRVTFRTLNGAQPRKAERSEGIGPYRGNANSCCMCGNVQCAGYH